MQQEKNLLDFSIPMPVEKVVGGILKDGSGKNVLTILLNDYDEAEKIEKDIEKDIVRLEKKQNEMLYK